MLVMYTGAIMRHSRFIAADAVIDTDTHQVGQMRVYVIAGTGQRLYMRLAGYEKARAHNGARGGTQGVWLNLNEWSRRFTPDVVWKLKRVKRNLLSVGYHVPLNRTVKTKGKRYRQSAPPMGYAGVAYFRQS